MWKRMHHPAQAQKGGWRSWVMDRDGIRKIKRAGQTLHQSSGIGKWCSVRTGSCFSVTAFGFINTIRSPKPDSAYVSICVLITTPPGYSCLHVFTLKFLVGLMAQGLGYK